MAGTIVFFTVASGVFLFSTREWVRNSLGEYLVPLHEIIEQYRDDPFVSVLGVVSVAIIIAIVVILFLAAIWAVTEKVVLLALSRFFMR